jgi:hypothetical protein
MIKIKKWFWVWNQEQEKKFLEEKAKEGLMLSSVGLGAYYFEESEPTKTVYQMDFRGLGQKISEEEYLQIYEDAGWRLVSKFGGWYYFSQDWKEGIDLSIFNDNSSKAEVYKRILGFLFLTGFPLYYQVIIMFPNLPDSKFEFPGFYFYFRIIIVILVILHLFAVQKIFRMYLRFKKDIKE